MTILMGRMIMKKPLWRHFSWWWRYRKDQARVVLRMLEGAYPGVVLSCRGLTLPRDQLQGQTGFNVSYEATTQDLAREEEGDEDLDGEPRPDPDDVGEPSQLARALDAGPIAGFAG
ncbi:MAG: hypothetical protein HY556_02870 [Euryarchaeota archaeon]|nr:hypothetical protein [Euryarchaeota archaeon]